MARSLAEIGLDSMCLSYVIDVLEGVSEPTDSLAAQRVALARAYFYTPGTLWTLPTVRREFERIKDPERRARHVSWTNSIFGVLPVNDLAAVERRAAMPRTRMYPACTPSSSGARSLETSAERVRARRSTRPYDGDILRVAQRGGRAPAEPA